MRHVRPEVLVSEPNGRSRLTILTCFNDVLFVLRGNTCDKSSKLKLLNLSSPPFPLSSWSFPETSISRTHARALVSLASVESIKSKYFD